MQLVASSVICMGAAFLEVHAFPKREKPVPGIPNLTYRNVGCAWSLVSSASCAWMLGNAVSRDLSSRVLIVAVGIISFLARIIPSYQMWTSEEVKDPSSSELACFGRYLINSLDYLVQLIPKTPSYLRDIWK